MPLFVKIERGVIEKKRFDRHVPDHLEYVRQLIKEGRGARTGYWAEKGGGMMVFEAVSREEAESVVARDPLVKNRCVEHELHEWTVVVG